VWPSHDDDGLLARHEAARSALDMGEEPALVRPGGRLGFVPTATLLVRVAALDHTVFERTVFDEDLRLGEDVDFVWRLAGLGWNIRYEPRARVTHESRLRPVAWARRRYEYGTSAAALAERHPGKLAPARPSAWNLAALACLTLGRRVPAAACAGAAVALLSRRLSAAGAGPPLAAAIVAGGIAADAAALGHALRREWWPVGLLALATCGRSRASRAATVAMLAPIALEWVRHRPRVDPVRYTALRLAEDAAYGTGVIASCLRARSAAALTPHVRLPRSRGGTAATREPAGSPPASRLHLPTAGERGSTARADST
jgi:mycofactocin system glycosyltransferase